MKNAKKVLALMLVVASLLGMMTFASAKKQEFTDNYTISKNEAVDVLVSMGIITGYTDGSFQPYGKVTRAEMATMISKLLNKGEVVADSWASANTFKDMVGVEWAAPHVAFCVEEGVINGRNATTFAPNDQVTGLEAGKMLLGALGYSASANGLIGADWAKNTRQLATKVDLFRNLDTEPEAALYREGAAQMLLNALEAQMVEYDEGTVSNIDGIEIVDGIKKTELINNDTSYCGAPDGKLQMVESLFPGYLKEETTDWAGRASNKWTYGAEEICNHSSEKIFKTYGTPTRITAVHTALGGIDGKDLTIDYYLNGTHYHAGNTSTNYNTLKSMSEDSGSNVYLGSRGDIIELYFDAARKYLRVVQMRPYAAILESLDEEGTATCTVYYTSNQRLTRTMEDSGLTEDMVGMPFIAFVDGTNNNQIMKLEALDSVSGTATKFEGDFSQGNTLILTVDGTNYYTSLYAAGRSAQNFVLGKQTTLWINSYNNVFMIEAAADAAATYAYVLRTGKDVAPVGGATEYYADLLYTDGSRESLKYKVTAANGEVSAKDIVIVNKTPFATTLSVVPTFGTGARMGTNSTGYVTNTPAIKNEVADKNTVFIVDTAADDLANGEININAGIYTGIANAPTVRSEISYVVINDRIAYVFCNNALDYDLAVGDAANAIYVTGHETPMIGLDVDDSAFTYYEYVGVVDGESVIMRVLDDCTGRSSLQLGWNLFYSSSATDSYYTSIVPYTDGTYIKPIVAWEKYKDGVISVDVNTPVYVDADTVAYVFDARTETDYITTVSKLSNRVVGGTSFYQVDAEDNILALYVVTN